MDGSQAVRIFFRVPQRGKLIISHMKINICESASFLFPWYVVPTHFHYVFHSCSEFEVACFLFGLGIRPFKASSPGFDNFQRALALKNIGQVTEHIIKRISGFHGLEDLENYRYHISG